MKADAVLFGNSVAANTLTREGLLALLEHSYTVTCAHDETTRLYYLADYIFDFTTYDSEMGELFASKALEVCAAITERKTFDYIKDREQYIWYLTMVNMPFFANRIEWGTSIRGAWWDHSITFDSCGIWVGQEQCAEPVTFTQEQWGEFARALVDFGAPVSEFAGALGQDKTASAPLGPVNGEPKA